MSDKAAKRAKFEKAWIVIRDELVDYAKLNNMPKDAVEWFHNSLEYNVPGGKLNRGLSVIDTAEIIKARPLDDDEYLKAAVLGWGVELLQAFFLVSDDLMDGSITRRGQPCWYRQPHVRTIAVNDAFMLEASIYYLLKKHFKGQPYYVDLLEIFHETTFQTELGQLIDLISAPEDHVDLSKFSLEKHSLIVIYKTSFYSFYLPVALAMLMCGIPYTTTSTSSKPTNGVNGTSTSMPQISHPHSRVSQSIDSTLSLVSSSVPPSQSNISLSPPYITALRILIPLGEYFQIQDDFLDFSGLPSEIGKVGTDIVDNKCGWVVNTALNLTSSNPDLAPAPSSPASALSPERRAELRKVLEASYGVKPTPEEVQKAKDMRAQAEREGRDPQNEQGYLGEAEKRVKGVFEELGIREIYREYEEGVVGKLNKMIEEEVIEPGDGKEGVRREVFRSFLGKIYGRKK
ncbi:hypothetical protein D9758_016002 [Tetrapyrgos nigripes]|uniref:(2E,6E)-farnesyl diphosphate synthase n=1 Tax=Tetrapyrgos nigripes TaxID=182062 RepID=A0A8H5FNP8_9AGAR|nr:hypothetical protein D9758_016002 [Tetrapyrgos nigripes]